MSLAHELHSAGVAGNLDSRIHRLDPRAKLIGFAGITVVAVSTPIHAWPAWVGCAVALLTVALLAGVGPRTIWARAKIVLPLVLFVAVFVPFLRRGGATIELGPLTVSEAGLATFATVTAKATIGTVSAVLLGATTSFPDLLYALERLRAPRLLVLIAAFMYRYLFVILDETRRMRAALAARGYRPRHALQAAALGRVATALFLRTYERGERVHLAMLARGWRHTMPRLDVLTLHRADVYFLTLLAALLPLRIAAELMS